MTMFSDTVYRIVKRIPKGSTMSYGEVAMRSGYPGAARAVGTLMSKNYDTSVPCHRVIRADGGVGAYNRGGQKKKESLLIAEGVTVCNHTVVSSKSLE